MKKIVLALFAVITLVSLAGCMGYYHQGNCEYQYLLHKDVSIAKWIGQATGGC